MEINQISIYSIIFQKHCGSVFNVENQAATKSKNSMLWNITGNLIATAIAW
jgi:hypothetical protein